MAETLAELTGPSLKETQQKARAGKLTQEDQKAYETHLKRAAAFARLGTAFAALALRQDVNASILAGTVAVENNYLNPSHNPFVMKCNSKLGSIYQSSWEQKSPSSQT